MQLTKTKGFLKTLLFYF